MAFSSFPMGCPLSHHDGLVNDPRITHSSLAIKLRLAVVRIPAGPFDPTAHEIIPTRNVVGIILGLPLAARPETFVPHRRRAPLVGNEVRNPFVGAGVCGAVTQLAESCNWNLRRARPALRRSRRFRRCCASSAKTISVGPQDAGYGVLIFVRLIECDDGSRNLCDDELKNGRREEVQTGTERLQFGRIYTSIAAFRIAGKPDPKFDRTRTPRWTRRGDWRAGAKHGSSGALEGADVAELISDHRYDL